MLNSGLGFLGLGLVFLVIGFAFGNQPVVNGLGKALFGVFVILFFIVRLFGGEKEA